MILIFFFSQTIPKIWMDLGFWDCFGKEKSCNINNLSFHFILGGEKSGKKISLSAPTGDPSHDSKIIK